MADPETLAVYSAKVKDYSEFRISETQERALARFLEGLPEQARILDLGCGPGLHAARMAEAGHTVTAMDAVEEFVKEARARGVDAHLGRFDDLVDVEAYDGVWASFSLLHAPRADLPRHLSSIARALRPGGRLFLGMKLGEGEHRDSMGRFYAYFSVDELRGHLDAAGFAIDHVEEGREKGLAGTVDPFVLIFAHA